MPRSEKRTLEIEARMRDFISAPTKKMAAALTTFAKGAAARFKSLRSRVLNLKTAFVGFVAVLGARRAFGALRSIATDLDFIVKTSDRLQITTESLSGLRLVADLAAVSFESFTAGLAVMQKNLVAAREGSRLQADAFAQLGIELRNLPLGSEGKIDVIELLSQMADGLKDIQDPAAKTAALMNALGRQGSQLGPLLQQGSAAIREQAEEARELGLVFDRTTLERAAAFNDALTRVSLSFKGISEQVFIELAPKLAAFFERMAQLIGENRDAIVNLARAIGTGLLTVIDKVTDAIIGLLDLVDSIPGVDFIEPDAESLQLIEAYRQSIAGVSAQMALIQSRRQGGFFLPEDREQLAAGTKFIDDFAAKIAELESVTVGDILRGQKADFLAALAEFEAGLAAIPTSPQRVVQQFQGPPAPLPAPPAPPAPVISAELQGDPFGNLARMAEQKTLLQLEQQLLRLKPPSEQVTMELARTAAELQKIGFQEQFEASVISADDLARAIAAVDESLMQTAETTPGFVDGFTDAAKRAGASFLDLSAAGGEAADALINGGLNGLTDALTSFALGTKSAKQAFKEFAASLIADLARIAIKMAIIAAIKALFPGAAASFELAEGGVTSGLKSTFPVKGFAEGGVATEPTIGVFGEAGAEAFVPLANGRIPVRLMGAQQGTYVFAPQITAMDSKDVRRVLVEERQTIMGIWRNGVATGRSNRNAIGQVG